MVLTTGVARQYALERNFAPNLFSLYSSGSDAIFQIDANFGFPAALLVRSAQYFHFTCPC